MTVFDMGSGCGVLFIANSYPMKLHGMWTQCGLRIILRNSYEIQFKILEVCGDTSDLEPPTVTEFGSL